MATVQELSDALVKADAAGDTAGATALAQALRQQQSLGAQLPQAPSGPTPGSMTSQGLSGFNEGLADLLGAPVELTNGALRLGAAGLKAAGGPDIQMSQAPVGGQQFMRNLMSPTIAPPDADPIDQGIRGVGKVLGSAAIPAGGAAAFASRPLASLVANLGTTMAGDAAGGLASSAADRLMPGNKTAQQIASLLGDTAGDLAAVGTANIGRIASPIAADAQRAAAAQNLRSQGIDLTAGQATGNGPLQWAESQLGGGATQNVIKRQGDQFTAAAMRTTGTGVADATPPSMAKAFGDFNQRYSKLAQQSYAVPDKQLGSDLSSAIGMYKSTVAPSSQAKIIDDTLNDITGYARSGVITGPQYQDMRSRLGQAISTTDGQLNAALKGIRNALDANVLRTTASVNPALMQEWQTTNRQYGNLKDISSAVKGAGTNAVNGVVPPAALRSALARWNQTGYVTGKGDLNQLARDGVTAMTPLPNSGTAQRAAVMGIPAALAAGIVGGPGAGAAGLAAVGAPYVLGRSLMSGPVQSYLGKNAYAGAAGPMKGGTSLLQALLAQAASQ